MSAYLKNGLPTIPDEYLVGDQSVLDDTLPPAPAVIVLPARARADRRRDQVRGAWFVVLFWFLFIVGFVGVGIYIGATWERGNEYAREANAIDAHQEAR